MHLEILGIFKKDLREERKAFADALRNMRRHNRGQARATLNRFNAGQRATEDALQCNIRYGVSREEGLALLGLFEETRH